MSNWGSGFAAQCAFGNPFRIADRRATEGVYCCSLYECVRRHQTSREVLQECTENVLKPDGPKPLLLRILEGHSYE